MPLYEFICICEKQELKEELMKFNDEAPKCSCGKQMQKHIAPSSFHLKGGGWAKDLYQKEKKTNG